MANEAQTLRRLQRLSERVVEADAKATRLRAEFRSELAGAKESGVTISAMARALGVSRQRVQQILGRLDRK